MDTTHWDLPEFKEEEFFGKKNKYCVCIPVINEADRIQDQLKKMLELKSFEKVDIIICDGGSTDGSVTPDFLKTVNVRTLLTKTDKGIVGAQLRMGYSYALKQGYEGVITMDGNNKDDPVVINHFVTKLDEGFDYIQGSRYMKGGQAINTPLIRDLAIRLIHVPMIRIKSGFPFTDTTNGNRAYSRDLLLSKLIQPFRDIFYHYEFLVYISMRANRCGFKVTEVPMTRSYPKGKTPTKITFFKGNFRILKSLFCSFFGFYNPKEIK